MADGSRRIWWAVGLLTALLVCYMLLPFVDVVVYGIFVYYVTRPVYAITCRVIRSQNLSAFLSLFLVALPVIVVLLYAAGVAASELSRFLEGVDYSIPFEYLSTTISDLSKLGQFTPETLWKLMTESGGLTDLLLQPIAIIIDIGFKLFLTLLVAYYLLKDGRHLRTWFAETIFFDEKKLAEKFFDSVDADLRGIFAGTVLVAVLTSLTAIVLFYVMDAIAPPELAVPYPFLLGLLCGLAIFVPGIGVAVIWVPLVLYLTAQAYLSGTLFSAAVYLAVFVAAVFLFVGVAPDMLLRPLVSSRRLHPGVLLCSYIFGYAVFGFAGLFLGPVIASAAGSFAKVVLPAVRD